MTIDIGTLISIVVSSLAVLTFMFSRLKEAEARGRLLQRIDALEISTKDACSQTSEQRVILSSHSEDLLTMRHEIKSLNEKLDMNNKKLDKIIELLIKSGGSYVSMS